MLLVSAAIPALNKPVLVLWGVRMSEEQRRRNPRYAFIASAELFEPATRMRIATRATELSVEGCYLDMLNPFPEDTIAQVKISVGDKVFETKVRVVYAHSNLGVGLVFLEPDPKNMEVLKSWIDEAKDDPRRLLP
jgi:PilZ domain